MTPHYLSSRFNLFNSNVRSTRQAEFKSVKLPQCKTTMYKKSFIFRGGTFWNSLSNEVRASKSISIFKKRIKQLNFSLPN